jgi:hypothetical protein
LDKDLQDVAMTHRLLAHACHLAFGVALAAPASAQNLIGAMNELAPFCLGRLCLGMSVEESRQAMRELELTEALTTDRLCQTGRFRDVSAVASPRGEASVAVQFRRYAGAGGLELQYRLWSIALTEASPMTPIDLERLREGITQRYHLRPTRDQERPTSPSAAVQGELWLRALPQWQVGVTTQYNPRAGSSIVMYALPEGDMALWEHLQPGCGKGAEGMATPGQRPPSGSPPARSPEAKGIGKSAPQVPAVPLLPAQPNLEQQPRPGSPSPERPARVPGVTA